MDYFYKLIYKIGERNDIETFEKGSLLGSRKNALERLEAILSEDNLKGIALYFHHKGRDIAIFSMDMNETGGFVFVGLSEESTAIFSSPDDDQLGLGLYVIPLKNGRKISYIPISNSLKKLTQIMEESISQLNE